MIEDDVPRAVVVAGPVVDRTESGSALAERPVALNAADEAALARAVEALETTSFATHLTGLVGRQIGFAGDLVPVKVADAANKAAAVALKTALRAAVRSLPKNAATRPSAKRFHLAAVAASGAVGGAFGLASLPVELPVSTTLILRSVADIARESGEDLADPEAVLACLEVFALGAGRDPAIGESGYFAVRALLAKSVTETARYMIGRGIVDEATPVLARFLGQIASRFGLVVSQKIFAQAVPVIGAVTGAGINAAFMDHYQTLASGHFTVRRLERLYGPDLVRAAYARLKSRADDAFRATNRNTAVVPQDAARSAPAGDRPASH